MVLRKEIDDYFENDNYQKVISIYENNKFKIINDKDSMYCVIDSFLALRRFDEAFKLVNKRLPTLISDVKKGELTKGEIEELDFLLESKIEILYEAKSYFKLLILLIKYGSWLEDRELVIGMYKHAKKIIERYLLVLLFAIFILVEIGIYFTGTGSIDLSFKPSFRLFRIVAVILYFLINLLLRFFRPSARSYM